MATTTKTPTQRPASESVFSMSESHLFSNKKCLLLLLLYCFYKNKRVTDSPPISPTKKTKKNNPPNTLTVSNPHHHQPHQPAWAIAFGYPTKGITMGQYSLKILTTTTTKRQKSENLLKMNNKKRLAEGSSHPSQRHTYLPPYPNRNIISLVSII